MLKALQTLLKEDIINQKHLEAMLYGNIKIIIGKSSICFVMA